MREVLVKNEEFKDSPVGKIPKDWEVCSIDNKLQQIIDYRGKTPEKTNSGIPLITAKNVRDGYLDPEPHEYIDEKNYDIWMRRGLPKAEDVLFTTEAPLGNVARVPSYKIALAQRLLTLRANPEELDDGYLFWLLNWSESRRRLEQKSTGSTVLGIKQSVFRKIFFRFPPLPEQSRIAEILDAVDEAIARTSSLIIKLKQTKAGLLQDLLTRGLDDDGKLRDPQAHPEQFKDSVLGLIPKDWDFCTFGDKVTLQRGFDITSKEVRPGIVPIVASSGITGYHDTFMVEPPGVITGRKGNLGEAFYIEKPYWPTDTTLWVKDFHGNNPKFICIFIQWMRLERLDSATACPTLNRNFVHPLSVAFPQLKEQEQIVKIIDNQNTRIRTEEAHLNKLRLQKQGLMQDLLTGKVRVKNL
ncbi:restriction endonuclease subunit S [Nostocaceae cyanobacterium CENA369]|uniref:Restriction endonuclease subunit S n=1 Tax=Dendronalium phyllosphericum CENA369 TaxID=1725256 RepID=A0A8J7LBN4_9NOST|nr:restriction endonuclease subunit S [Dendronalium phyllosphericum]MBH8571987.1 restriction endonuclease subunit S [Dendronalium phyllosphericum CENA369]